MKTQCLVLYFVFFVFFVANSFAAAAEKIDHAAALSPFLNNDTFAVAYLDVATLSAGETTEILPLLPALPKEAQERLVGLLVVNGLVKKLQTAGVQGLYLVAGLADIHAGGGPLAIATAAPNGHAALVEEVLKDIRKNLRDDPDLKLIQYELERIDIRRHGDVVLVGMNETVSRYTALTSSARNDFIEPLTRLAGEGAAFACVFAPGPDFRRVVRELWPPLPPPLTPLKGDLADRWQTLQFAVSPPPNGNPRLILQASDVAAAQAFVDLYRALPAAAEQLTDLGDRRFELKRYVEQIIGLASPKIDGTSVTLTYSATPTELENFQALFDDVTQKAKESSRRAERVNRFRQLVLAMHNYHDTHKHFPSAAPFRDKDGRPLLSWRVAILPFLKRQELYKQFRLDEPWDSPHNRALVERMPQVFADPDPRIRDEAGPGKTTFQVPVGAATIFFDNVGTKFGQISDGTSRTILIVEVTPDLAAVWTQPDDWEVDMQDVRKGIARPDRNQITVAYADGSVQMISTDADESILRANLTRGGREVADRP